MSRLAIVLTNRPDRTHPMPVILQDITRRTSGLKFGSAIPGGFMSASLSVNLPRMQAIDWYDRMMMYGIGIYEGDESQWEGRINSVKLKDYGVDIECEGYWASLADQTLFSWWADNNMSAWLVPAQGAGSTSNDITLANIASEMFGMDTLNGMFRVTTEKNAIYKTASRPQGVFYYRLPRVNIVETVKLPFQPMTIHSIQYVYGKTHATANVWDLVVWSADWAKGTWTERYRADAGSLAEGLHNLNVGADGNDIEAIAIGIQKQNTGGDFTETLESGERRWLFSEVTIYCERNGWSTGKITGSKIVKDLLVGNGNIDVEAHAKQIADDTVLIADTGVETVPAVFEKSNMQEIIAKVSDYGISRVVNLIENPSLEWDTVGWALIGGATTLTQSAGVPEAIAGVWSGRITCSGAANSGFEVLKYDTTRIPVTPDVSYMFTVYLEPSITFAQGQVGIRWYTSGLALISTTLSDVYTFESGDFTRFIVFGVAPSNAAFGTPVYLDSGVFGSFNLFFDAAQLAETTVPLVYSDGDQPGGIWSGTPHQSSTEQVFPVVAGVYGRRRLHLHERNMQEIKWRVGIKDLGQAGPELERSAQEFYTQVWARYAESFTGLTAFTVASRAWEEYNNIYDQRDIIIDAGNVSELAAEKIKKLSLEQNKRPIQKAQFTLTGQVTNYFGGREPVHRIRAGDLIYVQDILPLNANSQGAYSALDSLRIFMIREVQYDAKDDTVTVTPDAPPNRLDLFIAQLDVIPSLSAINPLTYGGVSG